MIPTWIENELKDVKLGDKRRSDRSRSTLATLGEHPTLSIPAAAHSRAEMEAIYRLFSNDSVDADRILLPHSLATIRRARGCDTVLVPQDGSELDYTRPSEKVGGRFNSSTRRGFLAHVLLAMTRDAVPLGVLSAKFMARAQRKSLKKRRNKPLEKKETRCWLEGYEAVCRFKAALSSETRVVAVSDSASDIYECLAAASDDSAETPRANFIVRACQNRSLADDGGYLYEELAQAEKLGELTVTVRAQRAASHDGRRRRAAKQNREAKVEIRAKRVCIKAPADKALRPSSIELNAVLVREAVAPEGQEPIEWVLLTDLPIDRPEQVLEVIEFYTRRWQIEIYFRVLKSGCKIEELQLETDDSLKPCIALYMIIAWRLMYLTMLGRSYPGLSADAVLEPSEWQSVYYLAKRQPPPPRPPHLSELIPMIARLGGYLGRSCDSNPGPKHMWIGLQRMRDIALGWDMRMEETSQKSRGRCVER